MLNFTYVFIYRFCIFFWNWELW